MADEKDQQQTDTGIPGAIQRPTQYPTATKIENGIAYDISGKALGPVGGQEPAGQKDQKDDDFFASLGGKPVQRQAPQQDPNQKGDDFFQSLGARPQTGTGVTRPGETPGASEITGIGARPSATEHVSGGKDIFGREIEASPTAARHQWAEWFNDLKGDLDNGTDATWVGWLLRKAGAKGLAYGNSPEVGHMVGGPIYGPAMIGHGVSIAPDRPVEGAREVISGVGTTLGPAAVTQPEALPFMAIAGSTSAGVSSAAQQLGADKETADLIGEVAGLASGLKMVGKSHLVDRFESSTNTYIDSQRTYLGRLREFENASRQANEAELNASAARRGEAQGTINRQARIEAESAASDARSNVGKAQKALDAVTEQRDQAGVKMRSLARQMQGTKALQKMDARRTQEVAGAHEDFKNFAPPTRRGPAAYEDSDLAVARGYLERAHSEKPLKTVQDHFDALDEAQKGIDRQIDPFIKKYANEPITGNVKMEVANKLAEQDRTTPGFLQKGLNALGKYDITDMSVKEADALRETLNAKNRDILSSHMPGSIDIATKLKTDPVFAANFYAMEALRSGIDGTLQDHGVDGLRDMRRDQASIIKVREAVSRQLKNGDRAVRGSGQSGPIREAAAYGTQKLATMAGAKVGGPKGAALGSILGERLGNLFTPADLTKNELAARTMDVKGAGRPVAMMTGGEGTPSVLPAFEVPPSPSVSLSPEDMRVLQREMSPLHAELGTHYGEHVTDASYEELEKRFVADVSDKQSHGVALEPAEKTLLGKINQQNAADAAAARQAAQEAAVSGKKPPTATLPENAEPVMQIPGLPGGLTPQEVMTHELAHAIVGTEKGFEFNDGIRSHLHGENIKNGGHADAPTELADYFDKDGNVNINRLKSTIADLATTYVAGGVAQDLFYNTPFTENEGLGSDIKELRALMKTAGLTDAESSRMIAQAAEDAANILSRPGVQDVIEDHSEVREPGLDTRYHVSPERLEQILNDVRGEGNEITSRKPARTVSKGNEPIEGARPGGKGEVGPGGRVQEGVSKAGEGPGEGEEGKSSKTINPKLASAESVVTGKQGGHAGGGVASEEELARPGRFVKISRSGLPTDQGKTPDFTLGAGEAGYQVKPGGQIELKAGQETPATRRGVEGYAKELNLKTSKAPEAAQLASAKENFNKERDFASGILKGDQKLEDFPYFDSYKKTIDAEAKLLPKGGKLLFIGSGPVPASSILFDRAGFPTDSLELDPETAKVGWRVARKSGMKTGKFMSGDARDLTPAQLKKYDGVVVALEAGPSDATKNQVLNQVMQNVKPGTKVLARGTAGVGGQEFVDVAKNLPEGVRSTGSVDTFDGYGRTHVLEKEGPVNKSWQQQAAEKTQAGEGFTFHPETGKTPTSGYMVEIAPEARTTLDEPASTSDIREFTNKNKDLLARHPELYVGGYKNELNVAGRYPTKETALAAANKLDQEAVWDAGKQESIPAEGKNQQREFPNYPIEQRLKDLGGKAEEPGLIAKAVAHYGVTDDVKKAGYILPDGRMLDFSDGQAARVLDHGDISTVHDTENPREQFAADSGAVRIIHSPRQNYVGLHFDMDHPPTSSQIRQIEPLLKEGTTVEADISSDDTSRTGPSNLYVGSKMAEASDLDGVRRIIDEARRDAAVKVAQRQAAKPGSLKFAKSPKGSSVPLMQNPLPVKGTLESGEVGTLDLTKALNQFSRKQLPALEPGSEPKEMVARAKKIAEDEAKYQLAQSKTGTEWYTTEMKDHDKVLQDLRPELAQGETTSGTDNHPVNLTLFKAAEAILSSGQKPYANVKSALRLWDLYKETGEFPRQNPETGKSWGPRNVNAYGGAFDSLNKLIQEKGEKGAADWLLSEHPVSELRSYQSEGASPVKGKAADNETGAMILGAKRGPFMQNLHGIESKFTADMWVSRTWNRWMGTLDLDPRIEEKGKMTSESDTPRNNTERGLMKESFGATAKKLGLSTSSLQAVLWYYEQALYRAHGLPVESWSFKDAAERVAKEAKAVPEAEQTGFNFGENAGAAALRSPETKIPGAVHAFDFLGALGKK